MTTIIGIEHADRCFLVADSRTTDNDGKIYTHPEVKKISESGMFLIAGSGETLPCDIAQHIWEPPTPTKQECMSENGYNFDEDSKETRFQFIMAVGGEIFDIDQELSISKSADGVYAAGSGAAYALGAIHAGADAYEAMEIASKLTAFTAGPYISKEQPRKIK